MLSPGKVNALPFPISLLLTYVAEDWDPWVLSLNDRIIKCHEKLQMMIQDNPIKIGFLSNYNFCKIGKRNYSPLCSR